MMVCEGRATENRQEWGKELQGFVSAKFTDVAETLHVQQARVDAMACPAWLTKHE